MLLASSNSGPGERAGQDGSDGSAAPATAHLDQDVARFFYRWGGQLSTTLVSIRERFDGDLDQYLLYLVFTLSELSQALETKKSRSFSPPATRRGLNVLSLAEITQIPRETTRRKLHAMTERGYLARTPDGLFVLGDRYRIDEFFADLKPLFGDALQVEARD